MISILIPVLGRPESAAPVSTSIHEHTVVEHEIVFLVSRGDHKQLSACKATGERVILVEWEAGAGDYARKMNRGYQQTDSEFMLLAADDLRFHSGWDKEVLHVAQVTQAAVIGTNDMGNPEVVRKQLFSTHPLVRRSYIDEQGGSADGPGVLCHEGYDHNFVDRELWDVAESRQLTAFAADAKVEHLHPHWGKGKLDRTYKKGLAEFHDDQRLYWTRCVLWGKKLDPREQQQVNAWQRKRKR
jgi:glycosyltransferase involved in cell wall biosynthesis